jgi:hypothetical protein
MKNTLAILTKEEYSRLHNFDYCDLYSAHRGAILTPISNSLEIFVGVNRNGRLFINVNFYPEGHRTFHFDDLSGAIKWAKRHVNVAEPPKEEEE